MTASISAVISINSLITTVSWQNARIKASGAVDFNSICDQDDVMTIRVAAAVTRSRRRIDIKPLRDSILMTSDAAPATAAVTCIDR